MKAITKFKPNQNLIKALAVEIKRLRISKKLTIEQLAEECGIHSKYLQTIERAKRNISVSVLVQIANALGIKAPKLLDRVLRST